MHNADHGKAFADRNRALDGAGAVVFGVGAFGARQCKSATMCHVLKPPGAYGPQER